MRGEGPKTFIHRLSTRLQQVIRDLDGTIPQAATQALVENLVHADFASPTVVILDGGRRLRVADHGPGIPDKALALRPGFSSAGAAQRRAIHGVGAGLPLVAGLAELAGGRLELEDNLGGGTVVTVTVPKPAAKEPGSDAVPEGAELPILAMAGGGASAAEPPGAAGARNGKPPVSDLGKRVLLLLAELGGAAGATIADELRLSLPAAELELQKLRRSGFLEANGGKGMVLTAAGLDYLNGIFAE